ncbi:hypothetical protein [Singulisphaera sp. GP187]|uniref:hypothetical protein n=1 Tax=Singulisphaera sp. GP187 TaxID=1882752 RepID=UPI001161496C|nr:hypothetical protein [Singulisphaera sp. GP187]
MRRGLHQDHPHSGVWLGVTLGGGEVHDEVAKDDGGLGYRRDGAIIDHRVEPAIPMACDAPELRSRHRRDAA